MAECTGSPGMRPAEVELFEKHLDGVRVYLEYGCGGSTVFAARHGVESVISVDSDLAWTSTAEQAARESCDDVRVAHVDIGPTGEWGHPADRDRCATFYRYAIEPWKVATEAGLSPQLVLVDGRFRVACFLVSLMQSKPGTPILVHDYTDRVQYHVVESFCPVVESAGSLAVFRATREFSMLAWTEELLRHATISD